MSTIETIGNRNLNRVEVKKAQGYDIKENLKGLIPLIVVAEVLGLLPIILILYWTFTRAGGLNHCVWRMSNWHIILSSISFIYLLGNAILTFRVLRNWPKATLKSIHASIGTINAVLATVSVWAAFKFHAKVGLADLYSVHSWIGMITLVVYIAQVIGGLYAFLYPGLSNDNKALLMPYHRFAGLVLLALAVVAMATGINEKAIFKLGKCYEEKAVEGTILNVCSILFTFYAIVVIYIASNLDYKRNARFEDDSAIRIE